MRIPSAFTVDRDPVISLVLEHVADLTACPLPKASFLPETTTILKGKVVMRHRRNYHILIVIALLQGLVFYAPVATRYRLDNGLSLVQLFLIESISWLLTIGLELPFGIAADRFGCRRIIIAGNFCYAASKVVFATASGFWPFLSERVLLALSLAALSGASEIFFAASVDPGEREHRFGLWNATGTAGLLFASIVSPLVYGVSLRFSALLTIFPYTVAAFLSFALEEPARRPEPATPVLANLGAAFGRLLHDRSLLLFLVAGVVVSEYAQSAVVFLSQLQYERAGLARSFSGPLFALLQAASLIAAASGWLSERLGRRRALVTLVAVSCLSAIALALSSNPALSVAALFVASASAALFKPLSTVIQLEQIGGADPATALSLNAMVCEAGAALANLGVGAAAQVSLPLGFGVFAAALGIVLLLSSFFFRAA
jgi:MFS family permease